MTFQIFCLVPWHCPITDGLVGHKTVALPMTYFSEKLAHKIAGRLEEDDYKHCGDNRYVAAPVGKGPPSIRSAFYDETFYD